MSKIIDQAKSHYAALCDNPKQIEVAEWSGDDGKPLLLFATPLTLSERAKARAAAKNDHELAAEIIIAKAKLADGTFAFTKMDKFELLKSVDSAVIERIVDKIMFANDVSVEDAEKN